MFVFKNSETMGYVKNWTAFEEIYKLHGQSTMEF